jgi:hypothetical protein
MHAWRADKQGPMVMAKSLSSQLQRVPPAEALLTLYRVAQARFPYQAPLLFLSRQQAMLP